MTNRLTSAPLFISKTSAALMSEQSAQAVTDSIRSLCSQHGVPRLIVIDTFARNMGDGDENSNADVGVFINRIDKIRAEIGCAVLLVHHTGHAASDRARGASALHAAMDTVFRLDKSASGMTMTHIKAKESELNSPLTLALEQVTLPGWLDANGDEMNSAVVVAGVAEAGSVPVKLSHQQEQALHIFRDAAKAFGQLIAPFIFLEIPKLASDFIRLEDDVNLAVEAA
ncbi:MAG: AAA family ATPase [Aestuariivirga sp.]